MSIVRPRNTKQRGVVEFLIYREKGRYVGVCLTFDIIEEGTDLAALKKGLENAATLHIVTVIKKNLSDDLLNRYAPKEYWEKYFAVQKRLSQVKIKTVNQNAISASNTRYTLEDVLGDSRAGLLKRHAART